MASPAAEAGLRLGNQRVLFVGGKGGVGKTTTSSALGVALSRRGERVLLVSTDPAHSLGDLWARTIGDREVPLAPNLTGMEINPDAEVRAYLETVGATMRDLVSEKMHPQIERQLELARLSPGAVEAAMLERMSEIILDRDHRFDRIIFDTAPTGHTLRLLSLPEVMASWTDGLLGQRDRSESYDETLKKLRPTTGANIELDKAAADAEREDERSSRIRTVLVDRREKFRQVRHILLEHNHSGFILVLIPERLPILESLKAAEALREYHVPLLGMVVNRVLPAEPLGDFLEQRREREASYLRQIEEGFPEIPRIHVPLQEHDVEGMESLGRIGAALLGEESRS
ncbi:MAG: ArsA family ATPase [Gemmatimonadota bacterium]|jgi:arsenite-transporting ATPase|nr:ArsA family ATPase [Gemmatimonadota bacterium]